MYSTHEANLDIPTLPLSARHGHIVPNLTSLPLISIGQLCDSGCEVNFTATTATVTFNGQLIMVSHQTADSRLWHFDLPAPIEQTTTALHAPANHAIDADCVSITEYCNVTAGTATPADLVVFVHAALFSPALSTLETAMFKHYVSTIPGLSVAALRKHPPQSLAMVKGHMDQSHRNQRSTKPMPNSTIKLEHIEQPTDTFPEPSNTKGERSQCYFASIIEPTNQTYSDQTGKFIALLSPLRRSSRYFVPPVCVHVSTVSTMNVLKDFFVKEGVDFQLAPPYIHQ